MSEKQFQDENKEEVREKIIHAATQMFGRFGFKKTTLDDIAHILRKGKSSIYYYFNSKEEVFEAVVTKEARHFEGEINKILDSSLSPKEKLRRYVHLRMEMVNRLVNYFELLKNDDLSNLTFAQKLRKKYDDHDVQIVKRILHEGIDKGAFKVTDVELSALGIVTALRGLEVPLLHNNKKADETTVIIDDLLNILFYGIVQREQ